MQLGGAGPTVSTPACHVNRFPRVPGRTGVARVEKHRRLLPAQPHRPVPISKEPLAAPQP